MLLYVVLGLVVPAAVINSREEAVGATGSLRTEAVSGKLEDGKSLFIENCKSCHTLDAVDAHGVTGPNLDDLAPLDKQRVLGAIKRGGTGTGRMPPGSSTGPTRTPWPPTCPPSPANSPRGPKSPSATLVAFSPQAPGFSVRRFCSGASMRRVIEAEAPGVNGAWGTQMTGPVRGESPQGVARLFQREPVS